MKIQPFQNKTKKVKRKTKRYKKKQKLKKSEKKWYSWLQTICGRMVELLAKSEK